MTLMTEAPSVCFALPTRTSFCMLSAMLDEHGGVVARTKDVHKSRAIFFG